MKRKIISLILAIATVISLIPTNIFVFSTDDAASAEYGDVLASFKDATAVVYADTTYEAEVIGVDGTAFGDNGTFRIVEYYEASEIVRGYSESVRRYRIHSDDVPEQYAGYVWVDAADLTNIHQDDILEDTTLRGKKIRVIGHYDIYDDTFAASFHLDPIGELHDDGASFWTEWTTEDEAVIFTIGDVYKTPWGTWYYVTTENENYAYFNEMWIDVADTVFVEEDEEILIEGQVGIVKNGEVITEVLLPQRNHVEITAVKGDAISENATYQWQILIDAENERWADIKFYNKATATLSYALVVNVMDETSRSYVRCIITDGENRYVSDVLDVTLAYAAGSKAEYKSTSEVDTIALDTVATAADSIYALKISFEFDSPYREGEAIPPVAQEIGEAQAFTYSGEITQLPGYKTYIPSLNNVGKYLNVNGEVIEKTDDTEILYLDDQGKYHDEDGTEITDTSSHTDKILYKAATKFTLRVTSVMKSETFVILYRPMIVEYKVEHRLQNAENDEYTYKETTTHYGWTDSYIDEDLDLEDESGYEGFRYIAYKKQIIAGDGKTVVQINYDREYYTLDLVLGEGGYGANPVSLRFGQSHWVETPVRAGYTFVNYTLTDAKTKDGTSVSNDILNRLQTDYNINNKNAIEMPQYNLTYTANWTPGVTDFTYILWKENADDPNFSYWGSYKHSDLFGDTVAVESIQNGSDLLPYVNLSGNNAQYDEEDYFTYCDDLTDKNVVIKGDGTTVVNIYYLRNTYLLYFRNDSGPYYSSNADCDIPVHTHCNADVPSDCTLEHDHCDGICEHVHGVDCTSTLTCSLEEHAHEDDCLICGKEEHLVHTSCVTICGKQLVSSHTKACFGGDSVVGTEFSGDGWFSDTISDSHQEGKIANSKNWYGNTTGNKYISIGGVWYRYTGNAKAGDILEPDCDCHISHTDDCYDHERHIHVESCYKDKEHIHNDSCYDYDCDHVHNADCYRGCVYEEHSHSTSCDTNKVFKVIVAKYEQTIGDEWPSGEKYPELYAWESDWVSKRVTLTSDMIVGHSQGNSVANGTVVYYAPTWRTNRGYNVHYMFESFDQTSGENGDIRRKSGTTFYDKNELYSQYINTTQSLTGKTITGFSYKGDNYRTGNDPLFLFYNRNRWTVTFFSEGNIVATKNEVMFEQPMASVKFANGDSGAAIGTLLSAFVPLPDPNKTEPGSVKFAGWYTTPDCLDGTEYDFSTAIMPNGNLELYAKWEPVYFNVTVYANSNDVNANNPLPSTDIWVNPQRVAFGEKAVAPARPESPYDFVGWFYQDASGEHSFVFATSQVRSDMHIYAKWESRIYVDYEVHYTYTDANGNEMDVADMTTGEELAGSTETFDAKAGDQLYDNLKDGMFPTQTSLAVQYTVEGPNRFEFEYRKTGSEKYRIEHYVIEDGDWKLKTSEERSTNYAQIIVNMEDGIADEFKEFFGKLTPDAYQKTFILQATNDPHTVHENNVVKFYWLETDYFLYQIEYYLQDLKNPSVYTLEYTFDAQYTKNSEFEKEIKRYDGFEVAPDEIEYECTNSETKAVHDQTNPYVINVKLMGNALIKVYYNRKSYKYTINYIYQDPNNPIEVQNSKTEEARFGETISYSAENDVVDPGYMLVAPTSQILVISSEETNNVMTFNYQEARVKIRYVLISALDKTQVGDVYETIFALSGVPQGYSASDVAGMEGFKFMGWYTNDSFTGDPNMTPDLKPVKTGKANHYVGGAEYTYYEPITYYGEFVAEYSSLMISNSGIDLTFDPDQAVIFDVVGNGVGISKDINVNMTVTIIGNGNVTITNLPVGPYTVTPRTDWSWRYTVNHASESVSLTNPRRTEEVTFASTLANTQWLSDNDYAEN